MSATVEINEQQSTAFAEQWLEALNRSGLVILMSIGHKTGLFDTLSGMEPAPSEQIAEKAGLSARYVKEWLKAMVTGGIIEYDPSDQTYHLPPEHGICLTREAGPENLAMIAQYIPMLASIEQQAVEAFKTGNGIAYEAYQNFHDVMAEDSGNFAEAMLLDAVLPLSDELMKKLEAGAEVMEVGCGKGNHLKKLATHFPNSQFTGYDLSEQAVSEANQLSEGIPNATFMQRDLSDFPSGNSYEVIFAFDAVHDQKDPAGLLKNVYRQLNPGGIFFMVDIDGSSHLENNMDHPIGPLLYTISTLHCTPVSIAQGGEGLGTMWGVETARQLLQEAGFLDIREDRIEGDFQNCYFICKK
ncbi:MAG: class I SAM-dependent methyltransferase [Opitutales bacterium]